MTTTLTRKRVGERLLTVIGKLDTLLNDTLADAEWMTERERETLRKAYNLLMPVESNIYHEETT